MQQINWKVYLPNNFRNKNYSIDELFDNYPESIIFAKPTTITLIDNEVNAFTKFIEYRRRNTLYARRHRAILREINIQKTLYNKKLYDTNNKLRNTIKTLINKRHKLLKSYLSK